MFPVLLSVGPITITAFGFFTVIAFLVALYVIWRLAIVYDFDKESIIDLFLLTSVVALVGSRLTFVLLNLSYFTSLSSVFSIFTTPGFYLWGGFLFGGIFMIVYLRRRKVSFWQVADIASVGLFAALAVGSIGCLMAGCQYGYNSDLFFAVPQAGVVGKRFPIQVIEGLLFLIIAIKLYRDSLTFHLTGTIAAKALIFLTSVKFITDFFRADVTRNLLIFSLSQLISLILFIVACVIYFVITKTTPLTLVKGWFGMIQNPKERQQKYRQISGNLTNSITDIKKGITHPSKVFRRFNIHRNPKNF